MISLGINISSSAVTAQAIGNDSVNNYFADCITCIYGKKKETPVFHVYDSKTDNTTDEGRKSITYDFNEVYEALGTDTMLKCGHKSLYPQELIAIIFKSFISPLEAVTKLSEISLVISVPVDLESTKRVALLQAAKIANLKVRRIIDLPTALANFLSMKKVAKGTFCVLSIEQSHLATTLYDDVENIIFPEYVEYMHLKKEAKENDFTSFVADFFYRFLKKSNYPYKDINYTFVYFDKCYESELKEYESECSKLSEKLLNVTGIEAYIISGTFSAAMGAALEALYHEDMELAGSLCQNLVTNKLYNSISVNVNSNEAMEIISKNEAFPIRKTFTFITKRPLQRNMECKVLIGNEHLALDNSFLGYLEINGIKQRLFSREKLFVTFYIDKNGILDVSAEPMLGNNELDAFITMEGFMDEIEIIESMQNLMHMEIKKIS